jgi:hypothetical protein
VVVLVVITQVVVDQEILVDLVVELQVVDLANVVVKQALILLFLCKDHLVDIDQELLQMEVVDQVVE